MGWEKLRRCSLVLLAAFALALPLVGEDASGSEEEREEQAFLYRFRNFTKPVTQGSPPASATHGSDHGALSDSDFKAAVEATTDFWNQNRGNLNHDTVIKLFDTAKDFSVVHALLETGVINSADSATIGRLRAEVHQMVLNDLVQSGQFGKRLGVNDFGTVGNAKSDIDFTPYAEGIEGARLLAAYEEAFARRTGGVKPGQMDIVAHKHEAVIPDWRKTKATADFVAELRNGRSLLRSNHEAYFLEGAYHQQVMGRSADGTTLTWIEVGEDGTPHRTPSNAAADPNFFYFRPDIRQRYAWGGAVGNWHFYHAHSNDKVGQAKYLLRSMDDGARLAMISNTDAKSYKKFESLSASERARVVDQLYRGRVPEPVKRQFLAVMEAAATIRDLKSKGAKTDGADAYKALMDLDRRANPDFGEGLLLERAKSHMDQYGSQMLVENNVIAAETRLRDWLAPDLKTGEFDTINSKGQKTKITIDRGKVERLQMSAFFELHDGIGMLSDDTIRRIKSDNPRFAADIDILTRVIEKKRQMALAPERFHPDGRPVDPTETRKNIADEILADIDSLKRVKQRGGRMSYYRDVGGKAWQFGQKYEDYLQRNLVNALGRAVSGNDARLIRQLDRMRASVDIANERFLGPRYMMRMAKTNSILEVLKTYVREGEVNQKVIERAIYEGLSYIPGVGTLMTLQGGTEGVIVLASTQLIPGYGQILLTLQVAKGTVELVGLTIFQPLRDDRITLAYQGYLEAEGGGLVTSGQRERVESKVPSVLLHIDPTGSMSLDERRAGIYEYFHDNITATINKDPNFPFTEDEWPHEWLQQEQRWLEVRLRQHINDWWNATGKFDGYDEILAFRAKLLGMSEEEFKGKLWQSLWKDYWTGRQVATEKKIKEREGGFQELDDKMAQIFAVDEGFSRELASQRGIHEHNGQMLYAKMLDGMPKEPVALEIIASPRVSTLELEGYDEEETDLIPAVSFRAEVHGSTEDYPYPWTITWQMDGPESITLDAHSSEMVEAEVGESPGSWPVSVTAIVSDAENREIARETIQLEVEKVQFGEAPDEDDEGDEDADEGDDEGLTDGEGDGDEAGPDPSAIGAAAASEAQAAADAAIAACNEAETQVAAAVAALGELEASIGQIEGRLDALLGRIENLDTLRQRAENGAAEADDAARELADLRDRMAALRDDACSKADAIATAATVDEQQRLLEAVRTAVSDARTLAKTVPRLLSRVGDGAREARLASEGASGLRAEFEEINALVGELGSAQAEAQAAIERARSALAETSTADEAIAEATAQAESAVSLAAETGTPEAIAGAQRAQTEVAAAAASIEECRESVGSGADQATEDLAGLETRSTAVHEGLISIRTALDGGDLDAIAAAAAEADATLSIVESFASSIISRADDVVVCGEIGEGNALMPPTGGADDGAGDGAGDAGSGGDSGWTATGDVEVEPVGGDDGDEPLISDPVVDGLIAQAAAAFSRCDFAEARAIADRIAERAPRHPWLASNYGVIVENEKRQRAALAALRRAESAASSGSMADLAAARAAAYEAAGVAPFCMVDRVTDLVSTIDEHIARETERIRIADAEERDRNRGGWAEGLGTLVTAIGAVATAVSGDDYTVPPIPVPGGGGGGTGVAGANPADPCTYKWSFANVYSPTPTCDCPGYVYKGVCVPGSGGGGGGGGTGTPEPVTDKDEGTVNVPSRSVKVCVTDVNSVLDDQYNLVINGGLIGGISNAEGGSTCYNAMLRGGSNRVELRLVAARGKSTYLSISMSPGDYSANFGGTHNHVWTVVAP